jgi:hypothetical protein
MEFEWYHKDDPMKMQVAKDLFLQEVNSFFLCINDIAYICIKLQLYCTKFINIPIRPQGRQDATWADYILGLAANDPLTYWRSLAVEVNAYLLDSQVGTSYLNLWQVHSHFLIVCRSMIRYWLQENQLCYPTIFALAIDVLPIQGSAVSCERAFSSGKEMSTA